MTIEAAATTGTEGAAGAGTGAPASAGAVTPPAAGTGTGLPADWRSGLAPDIAGHASIKTFKTPGDLAKSHVEAQALIGRSIQVPGAAEPREAWDRVWNKLGRPEAATGYVLKDPVLPEVAGKWDPERTKNFMPLAHSIGLSNWQAQQVLDAFGQHLASAAQPARPSVDAKAAEAKLRGAWGGAFEKNIEAAKRSIAFAGGEELRQALHETGAGSHPAVIAALARFGHLLVEDQLIAADGALATGNDQAELTKILNAPKDHPFWDKLHAGHKDAVAQVTRLNEKIHGKA
jgi:hypothetical protein